MKAKVEGCEVLYKIFRSREIDFCILFSSIAAILGGTGLLAYTAANQFLDSFATKCNEEGLPWISLNWEGWKPDAVRGVFGDRSIALDQYALTYEEALKALDQVMQRRLYGQIIVSPIDPSYRLKHIQTGRLSQHSRSSGKQPLNSRSFPSGAHEVASPTEELLRRIWSEVLGSSAVSVHDNLFELGGNSLIGLRIVSRIKRDLGLDIPVTFLFEAPTIAALAGLLDRGKTDSLPDLLKTGRERGERRRKARRMPQVDDSILTEQA
jgi:aryl carrier-like protein